LAVPAAFLEDLIVSELSYEEVPPTDAEILQVLADHFDVEATEVLRWIDTFDAEAALAQYRAALGLTN
jgi:hypothetical protein